MNARNRENKFGLSLIELLTHYDLPDATVIERHYAQSPRTDVQQWYQLLSSFRGAVIHNGHFDFGGIHDIADVSNVVIHLQDILTRIVLKKAGFEGQYVNHQGIHVLVDWVKDDTPVAQLGYGNWTPVFGTTSRKSSASR